MSDNEQARNRRLLEFLENDDFQEVIDGVRIDIKDEWSKERDPTEREELWYLLAGLERLETRLASWANKAR